MPDIFEASFIACFRGFLLPLLWAAMAAAPEMSSPAIIPSGDWNLSICGAILLSARFIKRVIFFEPDWGVLELNTDITRPLSGTAARRPHTSE